MVERAQRMAPHSVQRETGCPLSWVFYARCRIVIETLGNIGDFVGGLAVVISLLYVGFQLSQTRRQLNAQSLQDRINTRINVWNAQLDAGVLQSALAKLEEHGDFHREVSTQELEYLTSAERRAFANSLTIELVYFQNLYYQREQKLLEDEQSLPLDLINVMGIGPHRWVWKNSIVYRSHYPKNFSIHIESIVNKHSAARAEVEAGNIEWQDAMQNHFNLS